MCERGTAKEERKTKKEEVDKKRKKLDSLSSIVSRRPFSLANFSLRLALLLLALFSRAFERKRDQQRVRVEEAAS